MAPGRSRRKKRRTEDFSSDSDSSDDETPKVTQLTQEPELEALAAPIEVNVDIKAQSNGIPEQTPEQKAILNIRKVKLTPAPLGKDTEEAAEQLRLDKAQLHQQYLKYFANEYSDDIDELRKKPDFTDKLLVILAKALQLGANMFDEQTLLAILNNE